MEATSLEQSYRGDVSPQVSIGMTLSALRSVDAGRCRLRKRLYAVQ